MKLVCMAFLLGVAGNSMAAPGFNLCGLLISQYRSDADGITLTLDWERFDDVNALERVAMEDMTPFDLSLFNLAMFGANSRSTRYFNPDLSPPVEVSASRKSAPQGILARGSLPQGRVFTLEHDRVGATPLRLTLQSLYVPGTIFTFPIPDYPAENTSDPTFVARIPVSLPERTEEAWEDALFAIDQSGFGSRQVNTAIFPETEGEFLARVTPTFHEGFPTNEEAHQFREASHPRGVATALGLPMSEPLNTLQKWVREKSSQARFRYWTRKTPVSTLIAEIHCPPHATHLYVWNEERY